MLSGKRAFEAGSTTLRRNGGGGLIRPRNALASTVGTPGAPSTLLRQQSSLGAVGAAAAAARRGFSASQAAPLVKASALPSYVLNCPETQVTTLPNGLRVASEVRLAMWYWCCWHRDGCLRWWWPAPIAAEKLRTRLQAGLWNYTASCLLVDRRRALLQAGSCPCRLVQLPQWLSLSARPDSIAFYNSATARWLPFQEEDGFLKRKHASTPARTFFPVAHTSG